MALLTASLPTIGLGFKRERYGRIINRIVAHTNTPYNMPIGIGYLTNAGICLARMKKKKVNEMAMKKWISNPHNANNASLENVFGSTAPLATPRKTCMGGVSFLMYAFKHAATMSNAPATKPAVNALVKNDLLIKVFWVTVPDYKLLVIAACPFKIIF